LRPPLPRPGNSDPAHRQVAQAVADGLARHLPVDLVEVGAAPAAVGPDVELLELALALTTKERRMS